MFNLESAIEDWRQQMLAAGIRSGEQSEELESHLCDEFDAQVRCGVPEEKAFEAALREVGQPEILKPEFAKVQEPMFERLKQLWCRFAGVPNYQLTTNMNNSNQYSESRWATYLKTAAFTGPAMVVWVGFAVLVLPKLKQVCNASGMEIWQPIRTTLNVMDFVRVNCLVLLAAVVAGLVLLEWRSNWWQRYRKIAFGVAACGLNTLVLVLIAALAVLAVAAGAHLVVGK